MTAYLSLDFTQNVKISDVLLALKNAAEGNGFGNFQVDPGSIQAISDEQLPTDSPISTQEPTSNRKSYFFFVKFPLLQIHYCRLTEIISHATGHFSLGKFFFTVFFWKDFLHLDEHTQHSLQDTGGYTNKRF